MDPDGARVWRIGSRGSDLALWQARHVQGLLSARAGCRSEVVVIATAGDRHQQVSLARLQGKGFFTKEIEAALLSGHVDLAVHSHKDLPTESPPGLTVAAIPERGPAADCLLVRPDRWRADEPMPLVRDAVVGTGSIRRRFQLQFVRPDLELRDLRGNVPTRIRKLADGDHDAIVLAAAGLARLQLRIEPLRLHELGIAQMLPAPAQGALAIQTRHGPELQPGDRELAEAVRQLHHGPTALCVGAERLLLARFAGGCNLPLGAHAVLEQADRMQRIRMMAILGHEDGSVRRCEVVAATPAATAAAAHEALMR